MAYAYTIDAAIPASDDLVSDGAAVIREFKSAVLERILTIISSGGIDTDPWVLTPRTNLTPGTNNAYDLGVTGTRWRHGWLSGTLAVAGLVTLAAGLTISAGTSALQAITGTSLTVSGTSVLGVVTATTGTFTLNQNASTIVSVNNSDTTNDSSRTKFRVVGGPVDFLMQTINAGTPGALLGTDSNHSVVIYTNGTAAVTFSTAQAATFTAGISATTIRTASSTQSCLNNTFTTFYAFAGEGVITVEVWLSGANNSAYHGTATFVADGGGAVSLLNKEVGANVDLQFSGGNLQVKQTSGSTQNMSYAVTRVV